LAAAPAASSAVEVVEVEEIPVKNKDEVAIVVGSRKNSMTTAVRYF
jgi:hypothetical protein